MVKRKSPTITQANIMFFITSVLTLAGSALFQPRLGTGANLWINEYAYILFPPLLTAWINGWPVEKVYRFRKTSARSKIISILSAITMWPFGYAVSFFIRMFLDNKVGVMDSPGITSTSVYQNLLLVIGMVILAPICEEIFFRGFIQRAYEGRSKKYGYVIAALIFGSYHILNGISEVIPTAILGICMGFLAYRTGSLAPSMLFHATANMCAILFGGVLSADMHGSNLVWLCIVAAAGALISAALLRSVREEAHSAEDEEEDCNNTKISAAGILFLTLSAVYLITIGVFEIMIRLSR